MPALEPAAPEFTEPAPLPTNPREFTPEEQAAISFVESLPRAAEQGSVDMPPADMPVEVVMPSEPQPSQPEENIKVIRF